MIQSLLARHTLIPTTTILFALCMAAAVVWPIGAQAQNNKYGVADDMYDMYLKANDTPTTEEALRTAEHMYATAEGRHDLKTMIRAKQLMMEHYDGADTTLFMRHCRDLMRISRGTEEHDFYYYGMSQIISKLQDCNLLTKALDMLTQMRSEAEAEDNDYGILLSLQDLGFFYYDTNDFELGERYMLQAMDFGLKRKLPYLDGSSYYNIASYAIDQGDYEKAVKYCDMVSSVKRFDREDVQMEALRAQALFLMGDMEGFDVTYRKFMSMRGGNAQGMPQREEAAYVCHLIASGRYAEARAILNTYTPADYTFQIRMALGRHQNNWQEAYDVCRQWMEHNDSIGSYALDTDLNSVAAMVENKELQNDKAAMELRHVQYRLLMLGGMMLSVIALVVALVMHIRRRQRNISLLSQQYDATRQALAEAAAAHRQAEHDNSVKSEFLLGITADLQSMVGQFSSTATQLYVERKTMPQQERQACIDSLQSNSAAITTLLDGVLSKLDDNSVRNP